MYCSIFLSQTKLPATRSRWVSAT